jgi:hypothetical protein
MFGRLFQEFCVMVFAKVDTQRLRYMRTHQDDLRADLYKNVAEAVAYNDAQSASGTGDAHVPCGKPVILPASHIGGPRDMYNRYNDAMALVRKFGKPSYFITMTCNPEWPEIADACAQAGCSRWDRPDIVSRVFKIKLDALMTDITRRHVLGEVAAHLCVVEFQKRGLPHAHILLIMKPGHRVRTGALSRHRVVSYCTTPRHLATSYHTVLPGTPRIPPETDSLHHIVPCCAVAPHTIHGRSHNTNGHST